ncbi:MAG: type II secretion system F family protein [Candidatus Hydrogenedentes bacterium]|nr:type II secretion system F family protein [Candidatus Hydrogenedentota bacterium]
MATNTGKPGTGPKQKTAKRAPAKKKKSVARAPAAKKTAPRAERTIDIGDQVRETPKAEVRSIPSISAIQSTIASRTTRGVRERDVTAFLRQMIMLLEAGTPMLKALNTLANRGERQGIRNLVRGIADHVESGNPLWQAFAREERYFRPVFVNLIKAAEASGTLTDVLNRLVANREQRELMRKRVQGAMFYPAILFSASFGIIVVIAKWVIPQLKDVFEGFDMEIAGFTRIFMNTSDFIAANWYLAVILIIALVAGYYLWWIRNPVRRSVSDRLKLRVPILGPILRRNTIVEFCRTFAMLQRGGLSMMATLELCRSSVSNRALANAIQDMRDSVERGEGMEQPLRAAERAKLFPGIVVDMLVTGEETGNMDRVADQVADTYEEEVKIAVDTLGEAIAPVFTLFMGAIVLLIAFAMFGPIMQLIEKLGSGGI